MLLLGVLVLLVAGLVVLATLQYRWIDAVSEAEEHRVRASIELAARGFADDLQAEIRDIADTFSRPDDRDAATRLAEWRARAVHPQLVTSIEDFDEPPGRPFEAETFELNLRVRNREGEFERPRFVLVALNRREMLNVVLPELVRRHFGDGYDVTLSAPDRLLYRSNLHADDHRPPDMEVPVRVMGRPPEDRRPDDRPRFDHDGERDRRDEGPLRLSVWRRNGGVAAIVASARRRNIAVSSGVLLILATTFGMLLYLLRRADRLREQQTEFVAAISHELNTPVTALRSAGENLKDGIITDPEKLARYGQTIVKESARLGDMIEQVLEFAGMRARRAGRRSEPVDLGAVIEDAVAQSRWLVDDDRVQFDTQVDENLPRLTGDPRALTRAVQNLVANAVRHGGNGGWVGVRASRDGGARVKITVEDRGPGVDPRDASHLFEPFYRGRGTSAVRGSGLGLTIVQQVVAAHDGTIEVDRRRRNGAAFTMTLPVERDV